MISAPEREYALLGIEKEEDVARGKGMYTGVTNGGLSYDVFAHVILKNGKAPYGQDTLLVRADDSFTIIYYGDGAQRSFHLLLNGKNTNCETLKHDSSV